MKEKRDLYVIYFSDMEYSNRERKKFNNMDEL